MSPYSCSMSRFLVCWKISSYAPQTSNQLKLVKLLTHHVHVEILVKMLIINSLNSLFIITIEKNMLKALQDVMVCNCVITMSTVWNGNADLTIYYFYYLTVIYLAKQLQIVSDFAQGGILWHMDVFFAWRMDTIST